MKTEGQIATLILACLLAVVLFFAFFGCTSSASVPEGTWEENLTVRERVCQTHRVACYGGDIYVRGMTNWSLIVDGHMIRFGQRDYLLHGIPSYEIKSIRVETDPSYLNRWPQAGRAAIVVETKT